MDKCAFDNDNTCSALNYKICKNCSFRKTEQELIEGREKAQNLLDRLPLEQRKAIEIKYHGRKEF